jgi:hypothetical protein
MTYIWYNNRLCYCGHEINYSNKSHGETEETTEFVYRRQFCQIVNRRVDPPMPLQEENFPVIRYYSVCMGTTNKLCLIHRDLGSV